MNIVIPAAGAGSRFKPLYSEPKPYIIVGGQSMIATAVETLRIKEGTFHYILPVDDLTPGIKHHLSTKTPKCAFYEIDYVTDGAVQTALLAADAIDTDEELIITNCDQIMSWQWPDIIDQLRQYDAGLVTIRSDDPKHSYADVHPATGVVQRVVEKEVISNFALTGIHYWKRGSDFVKAGKQMIADDNRSLNEFYVSATYNYLIEDGLIVGHVTIREDNICFVGTPEDLAKYDGQ